MRRATAIYVMTLTLSLGLSACVSAPSKLPIARPPGQTLLTVISSGTISGIPWQSEIVRQGGSLCSQAVVGYKIMATSCATSLPYPVNFEVEGNDAVLFIDGIVGPEVDQLMLITGAHPQGIPIPVKQAGSDAQIRFFGYAVAPSDAQSLVAYNSSGVQIYTDHGKIRGTWESRSTPPSAPASR